MVAPEETFCVVVYDVGKDRVRNRISETCLDYGLERFQFSAFWGTLSASRRKELFHRLCELLGKWPGRILVQPIGAEDMARRLVLHQKAEPIRLKDGAQRRKRRELAEPGHERPTILKL